jgi:predicted metalloprotease
MGWGKVDNPDVIDQRGRSAGGRFERGYKTGDPGNCDTFAADRL